VKRFMEGSTSERTGMLSSVELVQPVAISMVMEDKCDHKQRGRSPTAFFREFAPFS
jgi:hypothetical protein